MKEKEIVNKLKIALKESLNLQSHYALLLNQYDGGARMTFDSPTWLERLRRLGRFSQYELRKISKGEMTIRMIVFCPYCNAEIDHEQLYELWTSKKHNSALFNFKCPKCGKLIEAHVVVKPTFNLSRKS